MQEVEKVYSCLEGHSIDVDPLRDDLITPHVGEYFIVWFIIQRYDLELDLDRCVVRALAQPYYTDGGKGGIQGSACPWCCCLHAYLVTTSINKHRSRLSF